MGSRGGEEASSLAVDAESDETRIGSALAAFRARYAWNRHNLAHWLTITIEALDALASEPLPDPAATAECVEALACRHGADVNRLTRVLVGEPRSA